MSKLIISFLILLNVVLTDAFTQEMYAEKNTIQHISSRKKTSLDGLWQVIIDPLENGLYNHSLKERKNGYFSNKKMEAPDDLIEYDFDFGYQLNVPGDWNTQMEKLYYYEGTVWYKRSFKYHRSEAGRVKVYFEGVNYACKVYLNGKYLGDHIGGFTPFQFDVTDFLKEDNFLILKVDNKRLKEGIPTVNFDWWNYGGITRSVWLLELNETYIQDYSIKLSPGRDDRIEGFVKIAGKQYANRPVKIRIHELGEVINTRSDENGFAQFEVMGNIELWSPENPKLYDITISIEKETLADQIGFKTIEAVGTEIRLNGKPFFLKGISVHEEAPFGAGRVTGNEQCSILLNWAKELGCNYIRLAHYPHNEFMVREAEKLGLLIWSEIPVYWSVSYDNRKTYQNAENQLSEMINRDKNRVGIGLWSIANETPITSERLEFLKKLIHKARELDGSRLITAALNTQRGNANEVVIDDPLGEYIDVIGINSYCGWYSRKPQQCRDMIWKNKFDKPMIMSEMGAGALQGLRGDKGQIWTEEYQAEVYRCNLEMIEKIDFLSGLSPWILVDFRSPRRNLRAIQNDYNRKGLISENGVKKEAFFVLQDFYSKKR